MGRIMTCCATSGCSPVLRNPALLSSTATSQDFLREGAKSMGSPTSEHKPLLVAFAHFLQFTLFLPKAKGDAVTDTAPPCSAHHVAALPGFFTFGCLQESETAPLTASSTSQLVKCLHFLLLPSILLCTTTTLCRTTASTTTTVRTVMSDG